MQVNQKEETPETAMPRCFSLHCLSSKIKAANSVRASDKMQENAGQKM